MKIKFLSLLLTLFLITPAQAQLVSHPEGKIMGYRGLDTRSTKPTIADGRASDLQNVKLSATLDLRKRYGYSIINDTLDDLDIDSPAITEIFDSEYSNGNSWILAFVGSKLKYENSGSWDTVTGTATITTGQDNRWKCIMALDSAVCTNDTDVPIKVSSTPTKSVLDVSDLSDTLTKAKDVIWYRNYIIFANTVENGTERPTRLRWSNVGTIETYTDDDFVDIATFAGDEIIGLTELYGDLYIFLKKSIWKASLVGGNDLFAFQKVIDGIGGVARDSIKTIQLSDNRNAVVFLDERKKVLMFTGVSVVDLGALIQPTLTSLNEARLQYADAVFDGQSYYLTVSGSGESTNNLLLELQTEIFEWTKHIDINANVLGEIKNSDLKIRTYFGNYDAFVYWMDNPDQFNDVDGAVGIVDSVGTLDTDTITGAQILIDSGISDGAYTGATVKITSGTAAGEERTITTMTTTGVVVSTAFTTTPDSTSVYSIGAIDAYYTAKPYDLGDAAREKSFLGMLFWAEEASSNEVDVSFAIDFGSTIASETISLSPASTSLWDSAIWDESVWATTGDKIYTKKLSGFGNFIEPKFSNDSIDESFHLYGYNLLGVNGEIKQ